jgi:hypothetical protein
MTVAEAFTSRLQPKRGGCISLQSSDEAVAMRVRRTLHPTLRDSLQPTSTCKPVDVHDNYPVGRPNSESRFFLQVPSEQRL